MKTLRPRVRNLPSFFLGTRSLIKGLQLSLIALWGSGCATTLTPPDKSEGDDASDKDNFDESRTGAIDQTQSLFKLGVIPVATAPVFEGANVLTSSPNFNIFLGASQPLFGFTDPPTESTQSGTKPSAVVTAPNPTPIAPAPTLGISGYAVNGYLSNALVFQDRNFDFFLDLNEKVALTGNDGAFSLEGAVPGDGQIVVKAISTADLAEVIIAANRVGTAPVLTALERGTTYIDSISENEKEFDGVFISQSNASEVFVTPVSSLAALTGDSLSEDLIKIIFGVEPNENHLAVSDESFQSVQGINALSSFLQSTYQVTNSQEISDIPFSEFAKSLANDLKAIVSGTTESLGAPDISKALLNSERLINIVEKTYLEQTGKLLPEGSKLIFQENFTPRIREIIDFTPTSALSLVKDSGIYDFDRVTNTINLEGEFINEMGIYDISILNTGENIIPKQDIEFKGISGLDIKDTDLFSGLVDGNYQIYVTNSEGEKRSIDVIKDSTSPFITGEQSLPSPMLTDSSNPFLPTSSDDWITNDSQLSRIFLQELSHLLGSGDYIEYRITNLSQQEPAAWKSYYAFPDLANSLTPVSGDYLLQFRISDKAGNFNEPLSYAIRFDNIAPNNYQESVTLVIDTGRFNDDSISNSIDFELIPLEEGEWYVFNTIASGNELVNEKWSFNEIERITEDGAYELYIKSIDAAGNESPIQTFSFTLDTQAPKLLDIDKILYTTDASGILASKQAYLYTNGKDSTGEFLQYKVISNGSSDSLIEGTWGYAIPSELQDGLYSMAVRRIDLAGNVSEEFLFDGIYYVPGLRSTGPTLEQFARIETYLMDPRYDSEDLSSLGISVDVIRRTLTENLEIESYSFKVTGHDPVTSSLVERSLISDNVSRAPSLSVNETLLINNQGVNTFFSNNQAFFDNNDITILGGDGHDRAENVGVGDIFWGDGGVDVLEISSNAEILGIGVMSQDEIEAYLQYFESLSPSVAKAYPEDSLLKLFLRETTPIGVEEGIAVSTSEVIKYGNSNERFYYLSDGVLNLSGLDDELFLDGDGIKVNGGAGADTLIGGSGNDHLVTGSGDPEGLKLELLFGGAGNDFLVISDGGRNEINKVQVDGGSGSDTIVIQHGESTIDSGTGSDVVIIDPGSSDIANRIIAQVFNLTPQDKVLLQGISPSAKSGLVTQYDLGTLSVDLTHAYHNYSDMRISMGSQLSMSIDPAYSSDVSEEFLMGLLDFSDSEIGLLENFS